MNKLFLHLAVLASITCLTQSAFATHNRAGEITYVHRPDSGALVYEIIVTTYTKTSAQADRPWLKIRWGDEASDVTEEQLDSLSRSVEDENFGNDIQRNVYRGFHTYAGPGTFHISIEDPNRNAGILNINNGEGTSDEDDKTSTSVMAIFALETTLIISPGVNGHNDSVILTNPPTEIACINQPWEHNPGAYDPNGDELVYSLVPCLGAGLQPLLGWEAPEVYTDSPDDTFTINSVTGDISWQEPLVAGEYNIAILIQEFRDGQLVGEVLRDMQITVVNCNNEPPIVNPLPDYCVEANGTPLSVAVSFSDPDGDAVTVTPYSGILTAVEHDATWNAGTHTLTWAPECEEVRNEPYFVSFSATDDGFPNLTDIETVSILVVAPRVENPIAIASGNQVTLSWDVTPCLDAFETYELPFVSYTIYRHQGFTGFVPDFCELSVPAYTGYTLVGTVNGATNNTFTDNDVIFGGEFCYMIVTVWPDGAQSYASAETCVTIRKEAPVMIKASIEITDVSLGVDTVQWSAPSDLDTTLFPQPFQYRLYHQTDFNMPDELIYSSPEFEFLNQGPTEYFHTGINTVDFGHNYRIEFYSLGEKVNSSANASTVFLQLVPGDNTITLNMIHDTPWTNYNFVIYRKAPGETEFTQYDETPEPVYVDDSLVNNLEYCYRVKSVGTYGAPGVPDPLYNFSQVVCGNPYDQTPPCPPMLELTHNCTEQTVDLVWNDPNFSCADDVTAYNIYYSPIQGQPLQLIATIDGASNTTYFFVDEDEPVSIAGCYAITALDSLNLWPDGELHRNESDFSNVICIDNCPIYFLPNIFTPNGDGSNDLFIPFEYRYVQSIDLKIFNRWGSLVFQTEDPDIMWDGKNRDSGNMSSDGVYYYTIRVNTIRLSGIVTEDFSGTIRLMGGKETGGSGQ